MNDNSDSQAAADDAAVDQTSQQQSSKAFGWKKIGLLIAVVGIFVVLYYNYRDDISFETVAAQEGALLEYGHEHPVLVVALSFIVYVAVTGMSLPGAAGLTLTIGWLFKSLYGDVRGFLIALVLVSFASTLGATIAFLLSRFLFRDAIQAKFGQHLGRFNRALEREGAFYLFTLRLIPQVPFFVLNVVMGLTPIRLTTYWWVSQVGMLAGTCVYVYAGSAIPSLQELVPQIEERGMWAILSPSLFVAFILLGLFPIVVKKIMSRFRPAAVEN